MRGRGSQDTRARSALAYAKIVTMMMRIIRRSLRKMTTGMRMDLAWTKTITTIMMMWRNFRILTMMKGLAWISSADKDTLTSVLLLRF